MSATAGAASAIPLLPIPPAQHALALTGIHAAYGKIEVVHGIDLVATPGRVLALFGPNGAGKSTILKVAGGGLRPTRGSVHWAGQPVRSFSPHRAVARGVCWIPEGRGVFPNLTVRENLLMWTYREGVSRAIVEEASFSRFPVLGERRNQLAGTLSGGEQQMLALARALAGSPVALLVDELSMGLAPKIVSELFEVIGELARGGMAIVLVEQFVHAALEVATDAALIIQGIVVEEGDPAAVAEAARRSYLAAGGPAV